MSCSIGRVGREGIGMELVGGHVCSQCCDVRLVGVNSYVLGQQR